MEKKLLEELYDRFGREIYRYLSALCGNRLIAEDIMQEVFCKALISLPSSHVNARAWLYMVGRNLLYNEMKKRRRELYAENMEMEQAQSDNGGAYDGNDGNPEQRTIQKEESEMLTRAMLSLDPRKREILTLAYFEHFTLKEAAAIMGISYENARILSMRAKKELRRNMEVNGYEIS